MKLRCLILGHDWELSKKSTYLGEGIFVCKYCNKNKVKKL